MKVRAKVISGRDESFEVSEEITVEQFRRLVSERISISAEKIRLLFQGRFLSDKAKTLAHYGVQDGFVIHVVEQMNLVNNMPVYADEVNQQRRRNTGGSFSNRRVLVPPVRSVITFTRGGAVTEPSRLQELVRRAIDELPIIPEEIRTGLRIDMTPTGLTVNMPALNCPHVPSQAFERILSIDRVLKYMRFFRTSAEKENGICKMIDSLLNSTHWPPDCIIKSTRSFLLDMDSFTDVTMSTQEYDNNDRESAEYQGRYQCYPTAAEEPNMSPYVARHALASDLAKKHDELHEEYMKFQPHIKRYNYILGSHHVFDIEQREYLLTDPRANILCVYSQHVRKNLHKYSHALHTIAELNVRLEDPLPRRLYPQNRVFQFSNPSQGQISFEIVDPHNPHRVETARHQTASDMFRCTTNEPTNFDGLISLYPTGYQRPQTLFAASRPTNNNRTLGGTRRPIIVNGQIESPPDIPPSPVPTPVPGTNPLPRRRVFGISNPGSTRASNRMTPTASDSSLEGSSVQSERSSTAFDTDDIVPSAFETSVLNSLNGPIAELLRGNPGNPQNDFLITDPTVVQLRPLPSSRPGALALSRSDIDSLARRFNFTTRSDANTSTQSVADNFRRPILAATVVSAYSAPSLSTENNITFSQQSTDEDANVRMEDVVRNYQNTPRTLLERHAITIANQLTHTLEGSGAENIFERLYLRIIDAGLTNISAIFGPAVASQCSTDINSNPNSVLPAIFYYAMRDLTLPDHLQESIPNEMTASILANAPPATLTHVVRARPATDHTAGGILESLSHILEGATPPVISGVEIRLEPNHGTSQPEDTTTSNQPSAGVPADDTSRPTTNPAGSNASSNPPELGTSGSSSAYFNLTSRAGAPLLNMRQTVLRPDPSPDSPPIPIDPFLSCDSLLDLSGPDSAATGSMFHQISSSRLFNTFRDTLHGRRRTSLPRQPYGVPALAEIRMALTHNGEIISPSDEKCVVLIIQHAIRWILLLMRENDISRVEETAGRSRQIVGFRQLYDELISANSHPEDRSSTRASLFNSGRIPSSMHNSMPEADFGDPPLDYQPREQAPQNTDSGTHPARNTSSSTRASLFNSGRIPSSMHNSMPEADFGDPPLDYQPREQAPQNTDSGTHPARNTSSSNRRVHSYWAAPVRLDSNITPPFYFQTSLGSPILHARPANSMAPGLVRMGVPLIPSASMRVPQTFAGVANFPNPANQTAATTTSSAPTAVGTTTTTRSAPARANTSSIRIAVPVLGNARNLPTADPMSFAEQLARQVEENMRNMGASVSLLTNSRAGSPSSTNTQERSNNPREGITVRAPEQGTSPRAKKRKTETDANVAPTTSRTQHNMSIPVNSVNRTSWERIVAADVERQRLLPPQVCTFSRGYLAGLSSTRTVSSLPRSSSFTGIVDNLTHLSVDGFPESPSTQTLDFLDEPD